jgi:hypothetical protein
VPHDDIIIIALLQMTTRIQKFAPNDICKVYAIAIYLNINAKAVEPLGCHHRNTLPLRGTHYHCVYRSISLFATNACNVAFRKDLLRVLRPTFGLPI